MSKLDNVLIAKVYFFGLFLIIPFIWFFSELPFNLVNLLAFLLIFHLGMLINLLAGTFNK